MGCFMILVGVGRQSLLIAIVDRIKEIQWNNSPLSLMITTVLPLFRLHP